MTEHTPPTCPPDHLHGADTVCYIHHGCRCTPCRAGMAARAVTRRHEIKAGTYARGRVDVAPVREHLAWLRGHGLGIRQIAAATRIESVILSNICWGVKGKDGVHRDRQKISARYAARILALRPTLDLYADGARIDATGTRRRIEALACLGWTCAAISRHCTLTDRMVVGLLHARLVTARTARTIASVYDDLWDTAPTPTTSQEAEQVRRTIARADHHGWVPPLAWDDIDTDPAPPVPDPGADIDVIAVELTVSGARPSPLTTAERHQVVRALNGAGHSDRMIAAACGVDPRTILRDRKLLNIPPITGAADDERENAA